MLEIVIFFLVSLLIGLILFSTYYMHKHSIGYIDCVGDIKNQIRALRDKLENLRNDTKV